MLAKLELGSALAHQCHLPRNAAPGTIKISVPTCGCQNARRKTRHLIAEQGRHETVPLHVRACRLWQVTYSLCKADVGCPFLSALISSREHETQSGAPGQKLALPQAQQLPAGPQGLEALLILSHSPNSAPEFLMDESHSMQGAFQLQCLEILGGSNLDARQAPQPHQRHILCTLPTCLADPTESAVPRANRRAERAAARASECILGRDDVSTCLDVIFSQKKWQCF